jgi:O-antigen/teichoic acid export membrane protein
VLFRSIIGFLQWLSGLHSNELLQSKKSTNFGLFNLTNAILLLLISYVLLNIFNKTWEIRGLAILITELLLVFIRIFLFSDIYKDFNFSFKKNEFTKLILFGLPLLFALIPGWILNQLDKYIILNRYDFTIVGYYTFSASMSGIIVLISQSLQKSLRPILYNEMNINGNIKNYSNKIFKYSFAIITFSALIGFVFIILCNQFPLFKYANAKYIIFIAILSQAFFSIYTILVMILEYYKKNKTKSSIIWEAAILFLLINLFFKNSINVPAIAALISFMYLSIKTFYSVKEFI